MSKTTKKKSPLELENKGSLITVAGTNTCLGDLWHCDQHGTFDPTHGRVDVSREEAEVHNRALSEARLDGLDQNCTIGQGGMFYLRRREAGWQVSDFIGAVVSADVDVNGTTIRFRRKGKTFRGRRCKSWDLFKFRRVA